MHVYGTETLQTRSEYASLVPCMNSEMRQEVIEDYLQKVEFASLDELCRRVAVSSSTVRRDLLMLESRGAVRRTHGGARIVVPSSDEFTF